MNIESIIIGMLAETAVHPGVGQANSAIDLPVARERPTDFPFIPGSGAKGALRSWAQERARLKKGGEDANGNKLKGDIERLFGETEDAGDLLISDVRLLLLPVRSLNHAYVWLTCPELLVRLARDAGRAGSNVVFAAGDIKIASSQYLAPKLTGTLVLEDRELTLSTHADAKQTEAIAGAIQKLLPDKNMQDRVADRLAVVSDDDFSWFARYALPVAARNQLQEETKSSKNIWYEETLPPDTVMYLLLTERREKAVATIVGALADASKRYCRFGGNETLGQGWFHMTVASFAKAGA
jgi:CRISPR-associated protein Cmr4